MYDICTIGHITLDKVVTPKSTNYMPGGTSFYFSKALQNAEINYALVTAVATEELKVVADLRKSGTEVFALPSEHTVYFENIYSFDQNHREQNVLQKATPFDVPALPDLDARIFHLGPLLSDDISAELVKELARRGMVSLDIQGFLRYVDNKKVRYRDWADKKALLPYIGVLKANEFEMEVLTGHHRVKDGAEYLADLGVKEVIITLGSHGSVIYTDGVFHKIPAFTPSQVADATGCGDTYMAGYLYQRTKGVHVQEAGEFGAAMATIKIEASGPFASDFEKVENVLKFGAHNGYRKVFSWSEALLQ